MGTVSNHFDDLPFLQFVVGPMLGHLHRTGQLCEDCGSESYQGVLQIPGVYAVDAVTCQTALEASQHSVVQVLVNQFQQSLLHHCIKEGLPQIMDHCFPVEVAPR